MLNIALANNGLLPFGFFFKKRYRPLPASTDWCWSVCVHLHVCVLVRVCACVCVSLCVSLCVHVWLLLVLHTGLKLQGM